MCKVVITDKGWLGTSERLCTKPEYKDGLCKHHYDRKIAKAIPFKDRPGYREPTLEELKSGKLLHLKERGSHGGYRFHKGVIINFSSEKITKFEPDPSLFVIQDLKV